MFGFNWSFSRSELYRRCPRAFYFQYATHGEDDHQTVKRIKRLTTPSMMSGTIVDSVIGRALIGIKSKGEFPVQIQIEGERLLHKWWKDSQRFAEVLRTGRSTPKSALILEHHYKEKPESLEMFDSCSKRIRNCLCNFQESDILQRIVHSDSTSWGEIRVHGDKKMPPSFPITSSLTLWTAYDFHYIDENRLQILDWKSGRKSESSTAKARRQLGTYALYGVEALGFSPNQIRIQDIWLQYELAWTPETLGEEELEEVKHSVIEEAAVVMNLLNPAGVWKKTGQVIYEARKSNFDPTPDTNKCIACPFLDLCPEGGEVSNLIASPSSVDETWDELPLE